RKGRLQTSMTVIPRLFSCHSHRLRIGLLLTLALFASVTMRVNLNVAIIASVNVSSFRGFWVEAEQARNVTRPVFEDDERGQEEEISQ
ncbi:hypothetical protein PFISCL1PPCAC_13905, partial [Pristionchus fissidentatus]